jgi:hypothetical protein
MKKYAFHKDINEMTLGEFMGQTTSKPIMEKEKILAYMKSGALSAFTSEPVHDRLTGEEVKEADNQRTDGEFIWYESWIYHFEKYNLKLNDDFIEYVLNRPE